MCTKSRAFAGFCAKKKKKTWPFPSRPLHPLYRTIHRGAGVMKNIFSLSGSDQSDLTLAFDQWPKTPRSFVPIQTFMSKWSKVSENGSQLRRSAAESDFKWWWRCQNSRTSHMYGFLWVYISQLQIDAKHRDWFHPFHHVCNCFWQPSLTSQMSDFNIY